MFGVRLAASCLLAAFATLAIVANWTIVVRSARSDDYRASFIPLVGGIAGAGGLLLCPFDQVHSFWWIPLTLDWGSGLGLIAAPVFYLRHRRKQRSNDGRD